MRPPHSSTGRRKAGAFKLAGHASSLLRQSPNSGNKPVTVFGLKGGVSKRCGSNDVLLEALCSKPVTKAMRLLLLKKDEHQQHLQQQHLESLCVEPLEPDNASAACDTSTANSPPLPQCLDWKVGPHGSSESSTEAC